MATRAPTRMKSRDPHSASPRQRRVGNARQKARQKAQRPADTPISHFPEGKRPGKNSPSNSYHIRIKVGFLRQNPTLMRRGCEFYTQRIPTTTAISCGRTKGDLVSAPPRNGCKKREPSWESYRANRLLFLKAAIKELSDKAPPRKHHAKAPPTVSQTMDGVHAILPHPSFPNNIHALPIAPPADLLQQRQTDILLAKGRETKSRKAPSDRQPPQAVES